VPHNHTTPAQSPHSTLSHYTDTCSPLHPFHFKELAALHPYSNAFPVNPAFFLSKKAGQLKEKINKRGPPTRFAVPSLECPPDIHFAIAKIAQSSCRQLITARAAAGRRYWSATRIGSALAGSRIGRAASQLGMGGVEQLRAGCRAILHNAVMGA